MKPFLKIAAFVVLIPFLQVGVIGCGGAIPVAPPAENSPEETGSTIDSNEEALASIPSTDPSQMDYALAESSEAAGLALKSEAGLTAQQMGCLCDTLYETAAETSRAGEDRFLCSVKGLFHLALEDKLEASLPESGELYVQISGDGGERESERRETEDYYNPENEDAEARSTDHSDVKTIKIKHVPSAGLGTYHIYLCEGGRQFGYASYSVEDDLFTGEVLLHSRGTASRVSSEIGNRVLTDPAFRGHVEMLISEPHLLAVLSLTADGATRANSLSGRRVTMTDIEGEIQEEEKTISCHWGAGLGCGSFNASQTIPFAISAGSGGDKTYAATDDEALCGGLPGVPEVAEGTVAEFNEIQIWDCLIPDGKTPIAVSTPQSLREAGGEGCLETEDREYRDSDPNSCF